MNSTDGVRPAEVLVVDDDPRNRKLLEGYLSSAGHRVRCAPDGPTGLAMAHVTEPNLSLTATEEGRLPRRFTACRYRCIPPTTPAAASCF